jgi:hypothetical protein
MYEKIKRTITIMAKRFWVVSIVLFSIMLSVGAVGCATGPVGIDPNAAIIGSMDSLRQLREINERSLAIIARYNQFVAEQSDLIAGAGIDFREALRRYDSFVLELIRRIEELEEISRGVDGEVLRDTDTAHYTVRALYFELGRQRLHVYSLAEKGARTAMVRYPNMTALARKTAQKIQGGKTL